MAVLILACLMFNDFAGAALNSFGPSARWDSQTNGERAIIGEQAIVAGLTGWTHSLGIQARLRFIRQHPFSVRLRARFVRAPDYERRLIAHLNPPDFVNLHTNATRNMRVGRLTGTYFVQSAIKFAPAIINAVRSMAGHVMAPVGVLEELINKRTHQLWNLTPYPLMLPEEYPEPVKPDELSVSRDNLVRLFVGNDKALYHDLLKRIEAAGEGAAQRSIEGVSFIRRRNFSRPVWAFQERNATAIARFMGWTLRSAETDLQEVQAGELTVRVRGFDKEFAGDATQMADDLTRRIEKEASGALTVSLEGITFRLRLRASHRVWAFDEEQLPAIARMMGWHFWTEVQDLQPGELAVSIKALEAYFPQITTTMTEALISRLTEAAAGGLQVTLEGVRFSRRYGKNHWFWAFQESNIPGVARLTGWSREVDTSREEDARREKLSHPRFIQPGEFALSRELLQPIILNPGEALKSLEELLGQGTSEGQTTSMGPIQLRWALNTSHWNWVISRNDLLALIGTMGWAARTALDHTAPDDMTVTRLAFEPVFGGNNRGHAADLEERLEQAAKGLDEIELQGIRFQRKISGSWRLWTFPKEKAQAISEWLGWPLRTEKGVQPDEFPLIQKSIMSVYVGNPSDLLPPLLQRINEAAAGAWEVTLDGIHYERRLIIKGRVWVMPKGAIETLGQKMGWVLRAHEKGMQELQPGELVVTQGNIKTRFIGDAGDMALAINTQIEEAAHGAFEAGIQGVTFYKRIAANHRLWACRESDMAEFPRIFGLTPRPEDRDLKENETSLTGAGLEDLFQGNTARLAAQLKTELDKVAGGSSEVLLWGVRFYVRQLTNQRTVWALRKEDAAALSQEIGWPLRKGERRAMTTPAAWRLRKHDGGLQPAHPGEVSITQDSLQPLIVGSLGKRSGPLNERLDREAAGRNTVMIEGVEFQLRLSHGAPVWTCAQDQLPLLAKQMGWNLRASRSDLREPQANDVAVSLKGLTAAFIGNPKRFLAPLLAMIGTPSEATREITVEGIRFWRAVAAGNILWAFSKEDAAALAGKMGWKIRSGDVKPVNDDEVAVSGEGLQLHFRGNGSRLAAILQPMINAAAAGNECVLGGVAIRWAMNGPRYVWAFKTADKEKLAEFLGWNARGSQAPIRNFQKDEIPVAGRHLAPHFIGNPHDLAPELQKRIESAAGAQDEVLLGGVRFWRSLSGSRHVWAFHTQDMAGVAALMGWKMRAKEGPLEHIRPDEIATSENVLARRFVMSYRLARELAEKIKLATEGGNQVLVEGIVFHRRLAGTRRVWAVAEEDLARLGAAMDWKPRGEAPELIEQLGLEEAVALLGDDPLRLKQYIQLYHAELTPDETDDIAVAGSMRGLLQADAYNGEELHQGFQRTLPAPSVVADLPGLTTQGHAFKINGKTEPGVRFIQVTGAYTRRIIVRQDGSFIATLPIPRTGETNSFFFYAVKDNTKERGEPTQVLIYQTGTVENTEAAFLRLLALKEEVLESIKESPARYHFLLHSLEQSLLRHFTYGEVRGFGYLSERIRAEKSPTLKEMLKTVEAEFVKIAKMPLSIKSGQQLYFFQKYTIHQANRMLTEIDSGTGHTAQGVIIASEQGLGKTVTALVIINGREAVIITPNSVVSTWSEQQEKFMPEARMEVLEGSFAERQAALASLSRPQVVTNVEFTQGMTPERAEALSGKAEMLVVDEADYLGRLASQQSQGTRMIQSTLRLLLTATPFKKVSHIGNLLGFLYPKDPRFSSTRAFARAFPTDSPETLNALFLLMQRHTIRVRKKDVFEEYDPAVPLDQQSDRLPAKVEVSPERMGRFALLKEQCDSIKQLFTDYQAWCQAHRVWVEQAGVTLEDKKYKRFKEGFFPKLQALRQIMNDPAYFGMPGVESPKHLKMDEIVHHELDSSSDHKVIIFCKYVAEVESYLKRYERYGAIGYYGELPKDSYGYKTDAAGNREYYQIDEYENFVLEDGKPVLAAKATGRSIRALDYQRILFQNDPNSKILVATYDTGSVGVTLTGANAVIDDDLAPTYRDQYQADDRAHRIDNDRKKYAVRYYRLQALYPEEWLRSLDPDIRHDYFEMGTYDQIQYDNIRLQGRIFHRIIDGVGDESELVEIRRRFLATRMPFLFKGADAQDTEEATQPEIIEGQDAGVASEEAGEDGSEGTQGLLSLWKPLIPWLQEQGWSDTRIAGALGGTEELLFSGVLVSLGSLLLTHAFGISLGHALEITSLISGILFPLTHWKERFRLVGGQLTLAPPHEKKKDMLVLAVLGAVLRLAYAVPLLHLPSGNWIILIGLPLAILGHAVYNAWIASWLKTALGMSAHDEKPSGISPTEISISWPSLTRHYRGNAKLISLKLKMAIEAEGTGGNSVIVHGIRFLKRRASGQAVWVFKARDVSAVALAFGLQLRATIIIDPILPDEIPVSSTGFQDYFVGAGHRLVKPVQAAIASANPQGNVAVVEGLTFTRRLTGGQHMWTFNQKDIGALADHFHLKVRTLKGLSAVQEDEIVVSAQDFAGLFAGNARANLQRVVSELDQVGGDTLEASVRGMAFVRRRHGAHAVWTFNRTRLSLLAAAFKLERTDDQDLSTERAVGPGQVTLTKEFLNDHFEETTAREINLRLYELLGKASRTSAAKTVNTGKRAFHFQARKSGRQWLWVTEQSATADLPELLKAQVIRERHGDEVMISVLGFRRQFERRFAAALVERLKKELGEPEGEEKTKILSGGGMTITFTTRHAAAKTEWAIKSSDLALIPELLRMNRVLSIEEDELPFQIKDIKSYLTLETARAVARTLGDHLGNPASYEEQKTLANGQISVTFTNRDFDGTFVWALKKTDVKNLPVLAGLVWTGEIGADELPCSFKGFESVFVGGPKDLLARFEKLAGKHPEPTATVILGEKEDAITFVARRYSGSLVWACRRGDLSRVAHLLDTRLREEDAEPLGPDEIGCSAPSLVKVYMGMPSDMATKVRSLLGEPPKRPHLETVNTDSGPVQFFTRRSGNSIIWAFKRADAPAVSQWIGYTMRPHLVPPDLGRDEVSCSAHGLAAVFIGLAARLSSQFSSLLGIAPIELESKTAGPAEHPITFFTRKMRNHTVWAFKRSDVEKISHWLNLVPRGVPLINPEDEIGVYAEGMRPYFSGNTAVLSAELTRLLGPAPVANAVKIIGDGSSEVVFLAGRTLRGQMVWTFKSDQAARVARLLNVPLKTDLGELMEKLGLEEAIAILGDDPLRLKQYIRLYHPELAPEDVDAIAVAGSMHGMRADTQGREELHKDYDVTLPVPILAAELPPGLSIAGHAFKVTGKTVPGVRYVQVIGAYTRKIMVRKDGTFSATMPVPRTGQANQYFFYPVKDDAKERGEAAELTIQQIGAKEDTEAAFLRLLALKEEVLESIKDSPARYHFLLHSLEQSLLRHFTYGEDGGFVYLTERIRQEQSKALKEMLRAVEAEFEEIAKMPLSIKAGQQLYFFQKYTVYQANRLLTEEDPVTGKIAQGVIIANEQGLGKTVTALVIISGKEAVIITPNSVVSTWAEQEEKFLPEARMEILEGSYAERQMALAALARPQVVTNVEFTQGMTDDRADALSHKAQMLVVDEADYLGQLASQQSKGTRMIKSVFRLLLTATPFKKISHIGNLLGFLYPDDPRFESTRAFAQAFPADNAQSLNALFLLMQRHTIRIRKRDVFDEYDPAKPLSEQSDRLPAKVEVSPERMGRFALLNEQCDSIKQLFTDYQAWCQAHRAWVEHAGVTLEDKKYKRFKEGFFPKLQALRQIMNNPAYFGMPGLESPKHLKMDEIVHHELDSNSDHKVIIFCKFVAEVEAYLKRFESYGAIGYYGELPKDSNGYKIDAEKDREYYEVDEYENFVLSEGRPIKTTRDKGRPIRALDYQRLLFQNDPRSRVLVATYDTGSVGVTLTGAHAVIDDDLAPTYRDQYQADDRAHRIDNDRKKYAVRYYRLQALYPEEWLRSLEPAIRHDYFEMGTYDQIQYDNIRLQGRIFHRIIDGVGDESELVEIRRRFLATRMPFLFKGTDAQDTEEATAPEVIEGKDAGVEAESAGEVDEEGGSQGLLSIWKPLIPWLQERGWSDTRIAGVLGGSEEFLFSGVLVSLGSLPLIHVFGVSLTHALEITSFISGILFPLSHSKERYRLVGGQLSLAPPTEKKKDLITLTILASALRLLYALPLADLPFGHWNTLIALPLTFIGHASYNTWIAPRLRASLAIVSSAQLAKAV